MFVFDYSLKKDNMFKSSGNIKLKEIQFAEKVRVRDGITVAFFIYKVHFSRLNQL